MWLHPPVPPDARQCAGPRPVITHAGTLTEFIRAHTQATCPSFLYVETRAGERRRRRRRVGVCLGLTPYGCGMQLDLACAKHFRRADVACIHQNVLVLSSECPHRFVRRDLSLPKLCWLSSLTACLFINSCSSFNGFARYRTGAY